MIVKFSSLSQVNGRKITIILINSIILFYMGSQTGYCIPSELSITSNVINIKITIT